MGARPRRTVLGGTFDHLHAGHWALLRSAMRGGGEVAIGLMTDRYVSTHRKPARGRIEPYERRRRALARWLRKEFPWRRWRIVPLDNGFGRSVEPGFDRLVVSVETVEGGARVNAERRRRRLPALEVETVPLVLADDLLPMSSRRIRLGIIDRRGRRRAPIRIALAVDPPTDASAWRDALRRIFPKARFESRLPKKILHERPAELGIIVRAPTQRTAGFLRVVTPTRTFVPRRLPSGAPPSEAVAGMWPWPRSQNARRARNA